MGRYYKRIFYSGVIFSLLVLLLVIVYQKQITGNFVKNDFIGDYTYTKAICNSTNFCEDYEITCQEKDILKITPTGFAMQFSDEWEDFRDNETRNKLC